MSLPATIRLFLLVEATTFVLASLIHSGQIMPGYEHSRARIAEGVIALVLLVGWGLTWIRRRPVRRVGIAAQSFAPLGTLVGLFTVAVGVRPRTIPDIIYHIALIAILVWGLQVARASAEHR